MWLRLFFELVPLFSWFAKETQRKTTGSWGLLPPEKRKKHTHTHPYALVASVRCQHLPGQVQGSDPLGSFGAGIDGAIVA